MVVLRPTVKLAAHLDLGTLVDLAPSSDPYADWCVRSFQVGRIPHLLFSNTASLLSVVVPRRGVTAASSLIRVLAASLRHYLHAIGDGDLFDARVAPLLEAHAIARNRNRSVVGSMNDLAYLATGYLESLDLDVVEVHRRLNSAPMGALEMDSPARVFRAMLMGE